MAGHYNIPEVRNYSNVDERGLLSNQFRKVKVFFPSLIHTPQPHLTQHGNLGQIELLHFGF